VEQSLKYTISFTDQFSAPVKRANFQISAFAEYPLTLSGSEIHCSGSAFSSTFASNTCLVIRHKVIHILLLNPLLKLRFSLMNKIKILEDI
jgi:hypothetical protein